MRKIKGSNIVLIVVNAVLLLAMGLTIPLYIQLNRNQTLEQNIEAVYISTESISDSVKFFFVQQHNSLIDRKEYAKEEGMTSPDDIMSFLLQSNSTQQVSYQLIYGLEDEEYQCYSTSSDGVISKVTYNAPSYSGSLGLIYEKVSSKSYSDDVINVSGTFINKTNAKKSVAFYTGIDILKDGETVHCSLLSVVATEDLVGSGLPVVALENAGGAIIDSIGDYIANTNEFRSNNFYEHLVSAYPLTYSEAMDYQVVMEETQNGYFQMTNRYGEDYLFCYRQITGSDGWTYLAKVPISDLKNSNVDIFFTVILLLFLLTIVLVDGIYVVSLNKNLKKNIHEIRNAVLTAQSANLAKSSFLSRITHEIRTPLNAIIGYMTIAKSAPDDIRRSKDCIEKTEIAAKHLLTIINDVLDVSAIESGKMKIVNDSFNFKSLITAITVMFYSLSQNGGVHFDVIFENAVDETIVGDQMRINQILINLLNNAIKFTKPGGSVHLLIKQIEVSETQMKIRFTVSDTGIGMAKEYVSRIWEPFEQADSTISRRYGGTGLGLAITKTLTDMMDGTIEVESELNVGTTFVVELPVGKTEQTQHFACYDFSSIRTLVVDDDKDTCDYIKLLMNRYGVRCTTCCSGEEAVRLVANTQVEDDSYNMCLIDMKMPGMNGIETAKAIKGEYDKNMPVVILSAYDFSESATEAANVGITHFVAKPLFQSTLFNLLVDFKEHYSPEAQAAENQSNSEDYSDIRVLLAEDNEMNMEIAVELLKMTGAGVDSTWNGKQVCDRFLSSPAGTYDIILMDIQMPEMDGYTATRTIRNSDHPDAKTIPIVAMTANAFGEDIESSLKEGMNDHISKPIDHERLFRIVGELGRKRK